MADENDPNKPEDDIPETRPTGEPEAAPEQPQDEALFAAEPEPPVDAAPEPLDQAAPPPEPEPESAPAIEAVTPPFEPPAPVYTADAIDEPVLDHTQETEPASEALAPPSLEPPAPIYAADTIISEPVEPVEPAPPPEPEQVIEAVTPSPVEPPSPLYAAETVIEPEPPIEAASPPEPETVIEAVTPPPAEPPAPLYAAETIIEPEPDPEPPPAIEAPVQPTPAPAAGALPPNYFRAAGDPDEPPPEDETPPTLLQKLKSKAEHYWAGFRAFAEPRYVKYSGAARAFAGEMWNRLRGIKRPKSVREAAVWGGWIAAGGVAFIIAFFLFITWGLPSTDDLWEARQGQSITFVDINGHVILREGAQNAPPVDLETLPPYVAQAFIAIEDRKFYDHLGVDFGGIMRAGAENIRAGRVVQGGSTITQQLAKNLFLTNERSWRRKAQEIMLAFWLESRFSKDEILALYLSRVYFGAGAYGIEAAAERYFDRPARELTLLQSAMIAGLVKAPSRLNPARQDIAAARERATVVLNEMVALGFISASERDAALQEELVISRRNPAGVLSYYRDWIDPLLNEVIGNERDDFVIETTIDIAAQRAAAEAVELVLAEQGEDRRVSQAAALALDDTGGVRVIVGGRDYDQSQFNRATQARRQPGSSFKYFIYLAAMENGLTPWSVREDAPITISIPGQPDWTPGNYTNEFHGPVTLTSAYANSFNMVAIRIANEVGGDKVIDVARRLGVTSPLSNYHSLALGAQEMTLLEMVSAYGAMAADGNRVEAHGVTRIRRASSDETMWSFRPQHRGRVIEERPFRYMNQMMSRVVEGGTGTRARMSGRQIGGKTGTGNDYRDAWFIGYTPGMVGGVWVGNDNFTTTARVTGGSLPADIWARFMPVALRNTPARPLEMPTDEDYDLGVAAPVEEGVEVVGAPVGAVLGGPAEAPPDTEDRSLDFGPEG